MNQTEESQPQQPVAVTPIELWIQNVVFYIVLDIPAFLGNGLIFVLVLRHKALRTFFFALIAGHAWGRCLFSVQLIAVGVIRVCRNYYPDLLNTSRLLCHSVHWLTYFCDSFNNVTLFLLALDRTISLADPLKYRKFSFKLGVLVLTGLTMFILATRCVPSYLGATPFSETIQCVNFLSPVPSFWGPYSLIGNLAFGLAAVALYTFLFAVIKKRIKNVKNAHNFPNIADSSSNNNNNNERFKEQMIKKNMQILPLITTLICVNVVCVVFVEALMVSASVFPPQYSARIVVYAGNLGVLDRLFDCVILLRKSSELKKAFHTQFYQISPTQIPHIVR